MAVDTPVLERIKSDRANGYTLPSRMDVMAEEEHNARIKETYQRLINPENKIEDVFGSTREMKEEAAQPVAETAPTQIYRVENARADSDLFRAYSAINAQQTVAEAQTEEEVAVAPEEYEDEDLRPTSTTIQFQTVNKAKSEKSAEKKAFVFGKREKIIVAVFVAVVVALVTLIIVNSAIISNIDAEIYQVQEGITTVRGAIAGVNSTVKEIVYGSIGH